MGLINKTSLNLSSNFTYDSGEGDFYDDFDPSHREITPKQIVVPILFGFVFVIGIVGNGTLIYTVLRNRKMRVVPNIYIVSLSCGDLLLILISVPFNSLVFILPEWPFGEVMCKINEYLQTVSLGVSVFTLTALSADRYIAIVDPMAKHKSRLIVRAVTTAGCLWVVALLLAIPDLSSSTVIEGSHNVTLYSARICILYPTVDVNGHLPMWYPRMMIMLKFFVFFMIPLIIIGIFYVLMARILILSAKQIPGDSNGKASYKKQIETRMKVAKAVLSFVVLFAICWLPRHIYLFWYFYFDEEFNPFWMMFKIVSFCMAFINSCVNPFALYFLSNQFRKYYNRYLFCWCTPKPYDVLNTPGSSVMYNFQSTVNSTTTYMHSQTAC
ncbi:neuropeptide CCHamide-1 receptor-like [Octopus sinensis]|uniref:Neuropeptide CCHamide-1 receptor-like n=1 Tax=Octopus sinensis TaxID=2607531 RepID=A0A6P7TXH2_9MOLL|nr:neuropeptide CCHamide-1 receptor-like [Octopus sinensis]